MKEQIERCNCSCPLPWSYRTWFLGIPISTTVGCAWCNTYITRLTKKATIKAWNKYWRRRRAKDERTD